MSAKFKRAGGYVIHKGIVNGEKFVAIATMETSNRKTGNMVQIWFLLENVHPVEAVKLGIDAKTICRECPFAGGNGCYVNVGQAPASIWKAWKRGLYPDLIPANYSIAFGGRKNPIRRIWQPYAVAACNCKSYCESLQWMDGLFSRLESQPIGGILCRLFHGFDRNGGFP